jgi:ATP-dependent helicase HepA
MADFAPGQRWISDAETDLGLGTILKTESRLVTVVYMASGEVRNYSTETAPLTRVIFGVGDRVKRADGAELVVTQVETADELMVYTGTLETGDDATIVETQLDNFTQFNRPSDKLLNAQFDKERRYYLRLQTREMQQQLSRSAVYGLCGARIDLIPHQLYIANEVANRPNPRVLLADEVGLGKTIESALILHHQLTRGTISRVLIVVPEPLLHQWLVELRRRFNLSFSIIDDLLFEEALASATDGNPFLDKQLVLTSMPFLLGEERVINAAIDAGWDTLVIDEAHHLELDDSNAGVAGIKQLTDSVPSLLLLTATPEQSGNEGHFDRLRLLDPHRFDSLETFREEESGYRDMADIATATLDERPLVEQQQQLLDTLHITASTPQDIVSELIDLHGTGRVMFRNTRSAVSGFPQRVYQPHSIQAGGLIDWLTGVLRELSPNKVLLICRSVERVESLKASLRDTQGINAAAFHEEMSIVERDRAAEYFADDETGSQILLCSEIGSEGRNFQFLHYMILLDLPENADLLEQRIGRLDRIGQTETVNIIVPYEPGSADEFLQRWYHDGLNAFEKTCQVGEIVRQQLRHEFDTLLHDRDRNPLAVNELIDRAATLAASEAQSIEQGRDRLLELSSHRDQISTPIIEEIIAYDSDTGLRRYIDQAFDNLGINIEDQSAHTYIVSAGEQMAVNELPGVPEDGMTMTFRRHIALAREEVQFLSWEHPLVVNTMDQIISGGFGQVLAGAMQSDVLERGTVLLEAHYVFDCPAPRSLRIEQFLDGDLLRIVVDEQGNDQTAQFTHEDLNDAFRIIKRPVAKQLVTVKRPQLQQQLTIAEEIASRATSDYRQRASERATRVLGDQLNRLEKLSQRNPSIRPDELTLIKDNLDASHRALDQLRCVLDSVRVIGIA